jgi:hypothetical protein
LVPVSVLYWIAKSAALAVVPVNTNRKSVHDAAMDEKVIEAAAEPSVVVAILSEVAVAILVYPIQSEA